MWNQYFYQFWQEPRSLCFIDTIYEIKKNVMNGADVPFSVNIQTAFNAQICNAAFV
jgi:hypothetical protein